MIILNLINIRFIFNGKLSYFNINAILPEEMEFLYATDLLMFNATLVLNYYYLKKIFTQKNLLFFLKAIPEAEKLRCITSKLGQFLGLKLIEIIPLNEVVSRFIIDLNLPSNLCVFLTNSVQMK